MHRLAAGRLRGGDDRRDAEVALADGRRADPHRLVGELDVERLRVGRRVDRDGFDAELVQGTDDADGDLATVRYEDALNTGRESRLRPCRRTWSARSRRTRRCSPPGCS